MEEEEGNIVNDTEGSQENIKSEGKLKGLSGPEPGLLPWACQKPFWTCLWTKPRVSGNPGLITAGISGGTKAGAVVEGRPEAADSFVPAASTLTMANFLPSGRGQCQTLPGHGMTALNRSWQPSRRENENVIGIWSG